MLKTIHQNIIDHTVTRLLKDSSINQPEIKCPLTLHIKYSCDGTLRLEARKQKLENPGISDELIFTVSMVPIELCLENSKNAVLWKKTPSFVNNVLQINAI